MLLLGAVLVLVVSFFFAKYNIMIALIGGLLSIILSFLFVIVSARMAGLIGASNNPVSGMISRQWRYNVDFAICGWSDNDHADSIDFLVYLSLPPPLGLVMQTQRFPLLSAVIKTK